jgi:hypothetical protein
MPVTRYRSADQMPGPAPVETGSEAHWERIERVWRRAALLATRRREPGVRRITRVTRRDREPLRDRS